MKKIIALLIFCSICLTITACGETNLPDEKTVESSTFETTTASGKSPSEFSLEIVVKSDGKEIIPYKEFLCSYVYENGYYVNADGIGMFSSDNRRVLDKMPVATPKNSFEITVDGIKCDKINVHDAESGSFVKTTDCDGIPSSLDDGTYIISFNVTVNGTENRSNEYITDKYFLCIVVGDKSGDTSVEINYNDERFAPYRYLYAGKYYDDNSGYWLFPDGIAAFGYSSVYSRADEYPVINAAPGDSLEIVLSGNEEIASKSAEIISVFNMNDYKIEAKPEIKETEGKGTYYIEIPDTLPSGEYTVQFNAKRNGRLIGTTYESYEYCFFTKLIITNN